MSDARYYLGGSWSSRGQESSRLRRVVPETSAILDQRDLSGSPQYEGVTLADGGRLVLVSEPNYVEVYQAN